ncbi:MAG: UDP-N-acetylmuramoyl-L-alanyl-D-glutamate--2,6-diaminopimelate ligase [Nitrospirae bacterium]|nr:UDP-N-acetylmuramoyl-L-alanyl-D-glutamate--2,6-diaminopimelate ligase [Nitrospirota bacterium]
MKIKELIDSSEIVSIIGSDELPVSGISYDSRKVEYGHLFVAMQGEKADGHDFIESALKKGAIAVIHDRDISDSGTPSPLASFIRVKDSRKSLAFAANAYYREPSRGMTVIGITGTNGKTTTTYILKSILEAWGKKVGLIGTIQYMIGDAVYQATHTTPESLEFQALLHDMLAAGCSHVVTEVSSHALTQKRIDNTIFKAGVFTNLTRDHLDFHGTMDDYFLSKKRFFTDLLDRNAMSIINHDDSWGRRLAESPLTGTYTFGLEAGADLTASDMNNSFDGLRFRLTFRGRAYDIVSPLVGLPNVYNILSAAGAAASVGVPWEVILEGIRKSPAIRGRFEKVDVGQKFLAIVDYAHTEDALERLIYTARSLTKGKIITVFGCGGDRDRGKRPRMGAIATRLSDFVIITSDNPRSEKPEDIIREIEAGAARRNYLVEADRKEAIKRAVLMAEANDVLLVAGKGHEICQEIGGTRFPFNDREVIEESVRHLINNR